MQGAHISLAEELEEQRVAKNIPEIDMHKKKESE
jgi:hypothetical protein